jgi:Fic family protein
MPISWKGTLQQYVGRLHRVHQYKTEVQVYDYVDVSVPVLARMYKRRLAGATPRSGTPSQRLIEAKGRLVKTLQKIPAGVEVIPSTTSWYLADLGEARGKQELFTKLSPQTLKARRGHALIESAVSSNRIEGVVADQARVGTIVFGLKQLRDSAEEEIGGYRDALKWIHEQGPKLLISEETIRELHRLTTGGIGDAGQYKEKDSDIIEKSPDGRQRVRFQTVPASETATKMCELVSSWKDCFEERRIHPLILLAGMNLDFLCIHPFRDGNGRVSRLLLLLQCYHLCLEVGRYVSLERVIEGNKERYYETLEQSSQHCHEGTHDPWPYINYILFILKSAYLELEERAGQLGSPKGAKAEMVLGAIRAQLGVLAGGYRTCPGVGREWLRKLLVDRVLSAAERTRLI